MSFEFERFSSPEEAGVSSAMLLRFLDEMEKCQDTVQLHSVILLRHGKKVMTLNRSPFDEVMPHTMFSLSKSFTSLAAGFAVREGLLRWDTSVTEILPEEIDCARMDELRPVTLDALLCMGSGLDPESDRPSPDPQKSWASYVLSHRVLYSPKTHFHYNTFGTYLVSCMIQKVTGQTVRDYLIPRLFEPLDMGVPDWDLSPEGVCCGGFGLHLSCENIARFGQCLLQHGVWQGRQVMPEGWVQLATREHIANYEGTPQPGNEWAQGYGYQFWRCMDGRYRGDGAFGQVCMIDEKRDAVLAVTCGTNDMGAEYALFRDYLFPAFDAEAANPEMQQRFRSRITELPLPWPRDDGSARSLPEGRYILNTEEGVFDVSFSPAEGEYIPFTIDGEAGLRILLGCGAPGPAAEFSYYSEVRRFLGAYGWKEGKLQVTLRCTGGPDTLQGEFSWTEERLLFDGLGMCMPGGHLELVKGGLYDGQP